MKLTAAFILLLSMHFLAAAYPFTVPYYDEEFFLYPFVNYDQSLTWKRAREGRLYEGGFIQTSHGSQTTWLLMQSEELVINHDIGEGFSFRFRYENKDSRHLSYTSKSASLGLGYKVSENFALLAETEMSSKKEEIDLRTGFLYSFQTVYAYIGISFDDFLFDIKNTGNGKNNDIPLTFSTDLRFSFSRLYFFVSGSYGTGTNREWPEGPYAVLKYQKTVQKKLYARPEFDINGRLKIYSEFFYDSFEDSRKLKDSTVQVSEYSFSAKISNARFGFLWAPLSNTRIDTGISYASTVHKMDVITGTRKDYTINYPAVLPYILYYYDIHNKFTAEIGYTGSITAEEDRDNFFYVSRKEHYWDKHLIKLGFEYRFSPSASLYISAGQLVNTGVFGGGNARLNILF